MPSLVSFPTCRALLILAAAVPATALAVLPQVSAGAGYAMVLQGDGSVVHWGGTPIGSFFYPTPVPGVGGGGTLRNIAGVTAGNGYAVAWNSFYHFAWGFNSSGQLGDGTNTTATAPVQRFRPCGSSIMQVAAGENHVVMLCGSQVYAWGSNSSGQVGVNVMGGSYNTPQPVTNVGGTGTLTGIVAVAAGTWSSYAVRSDGTIVAWGLNSAGQLGDNSTTNRIAPVNVVNIGGTGTLGNVTQVAAGREYVLARRGDGSVVAWGSNQGGQLGNGLSGGNFLSPVSVLGINGTGLLGGIKSVSTTGFSSSHALTDAGRVLAWGNNAYGGLGDGTTTQRLAPVDIGLAGSGSIGGSMTNGVNSEHNGYAISTYGLVQAWGTNLNGELGVGTSFFGFRPFPGPVVAANQIDPLIAKIGTDAQQPRSDLGADLRSDIVWTQASSNAAYYWGMNAKAAFGQTIGVASGGWTLAGSGDFDGDGTADLLWRHADGSNYVWFMHGPTVIGHGYIPGTSSDWSVLAVNDFTGDGRADILWRRSSDGAISVWSMSGLTIAQALTLGSLSPATWSLAATGDLNGDGLADMVWRDTAGSLYVWITGVNSGLSGGSLAIPLIDQGSLPNPGVEWTIVAAADFDRNGKADLLFRRASDGANYLWRMNGKAIASQASLPAVGPEWTIGTVGDFDGDGMNDILFRRGDGVNYVWLMDNASIKDQGSLPTVDASWTILKPR